MANGEKPGSVAKLNVSNLKCLQIRLSRVHLHAPPSLSNLLIRKTTKYVCEGSRRKLILFPREGRKDQWV